ncbi:ABC transporter permease [Cylindrospermopsis raciborskii S07]|jgi:peptide/nickel transport system permease protein|uniref:ABC transporter permease n=3 Tax=Cylindrospermopsis raciborskii TaxID=77022 RepID=A0ABX4WQE1_9CYAN|nr:MULTISPECIES: ABC transporter permease [Cylindrospermopsis]MBU6344530.1 ABC transporter permease [Cyanobacteria bacterium REEB494]BAZ89236.1 binding-protein-dependent transporter inner membrane protein [Raphidiopsis curvata NIES-932]KRH96897.1 ABC transporter permease [Cylindrospermopsis sp. CR12]MCH4905547.1 ABC transporter permease subunit [Cylindrospermopsis raciborskii CHAB3438]MEB3147331.1 ABC transporter permease [Cylindrospermopsis raciborskii]
MSRSKALQYYIASRLLFAPLQLLTIVTIVFLLLRATPGDPADAILGGRAPESAKEELRKQLGLDLPIWLQYINYLGNILRFDLGSSLTSRGQNVWQIISQHFPATMELAVCSMLVALIVGILVGTLSASRPGTPLDLGGRLFGIITYALPMFWAGMLLQLVFSVQLQWFPNSNRFPPNISPPTTITGLYTIDSLLSGNLNYFFLALHHLALPSLTLGILLSGIFERIVRVNLKETLKADYVEAARARGIPENKILVSHALKNALIPVITVLGLTFASLLGGAILTEVTFSWPGLANRLYQAIADRDYTTVQGVLVFFGGIVVSASIVIDILNAYIDPRIRY